MKDVLTVILAGGRGERLFPLTKDRAKAAVPFGGIYRLIDFPLSNCFNSGLRRILVLTQYKSVSLQRHMDLGWHVFSRELGEFIDVIPAQQRRGETWYRGTADAIYQNFYSINQVAPRKILILAADHIYKMDYSFLIQYHEDRRADLTVGVVVIPRERARDFGVVGIDSEGRVTEFHEKEMPEHCFYMDKDHCLASMGIYVFNVDLLEEILTEDAKSESSHDFGRDIIPRMIGKSAVYAYPFIDENRKQAMYWRDVGTIDAYWESNMELIAVDPVFNLYDHEWPLRTYQEQVPPAKTVFAQEGEEGRVGVALESLVSSGCIISGGRVQRCILSPNVRVNSYARVEDSILMDGCQVGRRAKVKRAIVDKEVHIPPHSVIGFDLEEDRKRFYVSPGGVVVLAKGTQLASPEEEEGADRTGRGEHG